ncbi:helix-turn-helix domain-containing protein [Clostridium sp. PL3]|uniref:Helix-turn-helix domain-containing protein n=1 Tax=Clostridium thailandense TaxID=2794346 RepID=A0A949TMG4_9CLOT|nr:helix-turn-helix domain-containing protein [Clostridium thailandense]MBV7275589.1 helix-turn-helix domain-containing protein [Clostridium thailandense]
MEESLRRLKEELAENSFKLLEALAQNKGLSYIIEIGYKMLGNPFCIIDMSGKAVATISSGKIKDDPVWNQVVTPGYICFDTFSFYITNKFYARIDNNEAPFFWVDNYSKYPRLIGKIKAQGKHIATLIICEHERPYEVGDVKLTSILCNAFSVELQKNEFINYSQGLMYEAFIEDLLEGKIKDNRIIQERIKILNLKFKRNLFVLTINVDDFVTRRSLISLNVLRGELAKIIPSVKTITHSDKIVMLLSCDNRKLFFKNDLEALKKFFKRYKMFAGLSSCFSNMGEIEEYYLQSLEALKLGMDMDKQAILFNYEDYAVFHMADICSDVIDLKKVCHPPLLELIEYDRQNNTDYTQSLYAYIINSKNLVKSSEYLHIHRNSLVYRIEKIEKIINVNLNDNDVLFNLHFSFKLLEFMKITF